MNCSLPNCDCNLPEQECSECGKNKQYSEVYEQDDGTLICWKCDEKKEEERMVDTSNLPNDPEKWYRTVYEEGKLHSAADGDYKIFNPKEGHWVALVNDKEITICSSQENAVWACQKHQETTVEYTMAIEKIRAIFRR